MKKFTVCVSGNPNCGKTTLFNALTGAKQRVGNWPGVTVDRKSGFFVHGDMHIEVVDTPGIYSLSAASLDEQVARDFVLSGEADLIINIVDASNLERNLYLTVQLLEMRVPLLVALNMMDVATEQGIEIDVEKLSERLGCPVVPIVASRKQGVDILKETSCSIVQAPKRSDVSLSFPQELSRAVETLVPDTVKLASSLNVDSEWLAVKLLEGDSQIAGMADAALLERVHELRRGIENSVDEETDILIASARYDFISGVVSETARNKRILNESLSDRIDKIVLNRIFGIPIFLAAMYLMFMFTINLGGAFIDFFDQLTGALFVDSVKDMLLVAGAPDWLTIILADGVGGGMQTMATFIPPIGFMFLFLSLLEDSGYMARAAFVMDRFMRFIGLPGKSFIPMLVGFGCNVPAIMATRTLESQRDRVLTIMMNPFMSCGARLPVYALFAAVFFPHGGQNLVFMLYLIGIGFAVLTGVILKNTLLKGEVTPFVMELPPYHMPTLKSVILRAYDRLQTFMFKAGKVLIPVIVVLAFLNSLGTDGTFGHENSPDSVLASISREITPAFHPMGITDENWPATLGLFTGIFAKEAVVGTLDSIYTSMDRRAAGGTPEEPFNLTRAIKEAFATIPANLKSLSDTVADPLGISIGPAENAAAELEVNNNTLSSMKLLFGSTAAAFAYMLFVLLYFPCSAAIAAVYRETNMGWTMFAGAWTTFMAWFASTLYYQSATFHLHPERSLFWIGLDLSLMGGIIAVMYFFAARRGEATVPAMTARIQA